MMSAIALRITTSPGSIIANQIRSLFIQYKWELLFMGMVTVLGHLANLNIAKDDLVFRNLLLFDDTGAFSFPMQFIFVMFGGFWAFRIWEGLHSGEKTAFLSYPTGRVTHQLLRMAAGAIVFVSVITTFWLFGATVSEIIVPGHSWFSASEFNGVSGLISLSGVLNAYLYATILSLLFRRPEIWFLFGIPITVTLFMLLIERIGIDWLRFLPKTILGWPLGIMAGFGFPSTRTPGPDMELPFLGVVLMWSMIFAAGVYLVARVHREH